MRVCKARAPEGGLEGMVTVQRVKGATSACATLITMQKQLQEPFATRKRGKKRVRSAGDAEKSDNAVDNDSDLCWVAMHSKREVLTS
jgi:hypothetical protein